MGRTREGKAEGDHCGNLDSMIFHPSQRKRKLPRFRPIKREASTKLSLNTKNLLKEQLKQYLIRWQADLSVINQSICH